jgi:hypothetical protein
LDKGKITAVFTTLLLITTLIAPLLPQAAATPTTITTITPNSGPVGTTVRVVGEIDTLNGSYQIRWDEESVKNETCASGTKTVNDTFVVPLSAEGDHDVTLYDITNTTESSPVTFTVTTSYYVSAEPARIQEGLNTNITVGINGAEANTNYTLTVNVTDPQPTPKTYTATLIVSTNTTGSGSNSTLYYGNFSAGTNTNYVGTYNVAVIADNETLTMGNFTVGLTNATEYHRFQVVGIRAANYTQPSECAWVNITFAGKTVFSKNASAVSGLIEASWEIPDNASMGLYTVTVTNSTTPGTVKPAPDAQNFTIVEIPFQVRTKKLDGEVLADVKVDVYNATEWMVASDKTDDEGLASFSVKGGNYTFEAYWAIEPAKYVLVGTLFNQSIKGNVTLTLWCWIAHLKIAISPPLPFINVTLTYHNITSSFETNRTAIIKMYDMPTNISYTIEARRYGFPFYNETMDKLPAEMNASWVNVTIICPTYNMSVHVLDSKGEPLPNVQVSLTEWSSGVLMGSRITDDQGNANLSAKFGRYKVNVYNYSAVLEREVVLNETTINLIEDGMSVEIHCSIFNVSLSVEALDYFGQPIPNALVEVERKFGLEWVKIDSLPTEFDGFARFAPLRGLVGGDIRVSVYVAGKLSGTKHLYLDGLKQILFKIDKYTVIVGYPVETSQLIVYVSIGLLVVVFGLALTYRRLLRRFVKKKEKS